jgi:translation initiation factor 1
LKLFEGTPFYLPPKCERCGQLESECQCPPLVAPSLPPEKQTARVAVEKRKRGKVVTVVRGLADDAYLPVLLADLKSACGAGGTCKEGLIEIQGDHAERIRELLGGKGYHLAAK